YTWLAGEQLLTDAETLDELVFQALGAASVCWAYPEKAGVFNSDRAKALGEELLMRIGLRIDQAENDAYVAGYNRACVRLGRPEDKIAEIGEPHDRQQHHPSGGQPH